MYQRIILASAVCIACASPAALGAESATARRDDAVVRIGAVAYAPSAVTIFDGIKRYLNENDFASDYVLYSNYDALVAALQRGEVDVAWNTPLAHAKYHVNNGCSSQTLVMRDVDFGVRSVLVARKDSGIDSLQDLSDKRLVLGSNQAAEATVLPLHFLKGEQFDPSQTQVVSLDAEVDSEGNPCASPWHVLQAVREGRGEAGIITAELWKEVSEQSAGGVELREVWTSPPFSHCVFTAAPSFDRQRAQQFTKLMTAMDAKDPATADVMRLEGAKKWLPGRADGFADLVEALQEQERD